MAETIPEIAQIVKDAKADFKKEFKEDANIVVFAPGRVNLIGEHIDYNDGFVMPMVSENKNLAPQIVSNPMEF